jgi:hypothetical protein
MEAATLDEKANFFKVLYLHGKRSRKCDGHKREGERALPGEICCPAMSCHRREAVGYRQQKSADGIVGQAT